MAIRHVQPYNVIMSERKLWASLSAAAEFIDLSTDSILRRAVEFRGDPDEIHLHPCPEGKVRYKKLKLGKDTRQERRYYVPDLTRWLN
jgi:hypothetical protein